MIQYPYSETFTAKKKKGHVFPQQLFKDETKTYQGGGQISCN
jgi:hypothetical protein